MSAAKDIYYMRQALRLGKRGQGTTWPNPSVGCVLVKDDRIIGRGTTQSGGRPHAEVVALESAKESTAGATVYVSLEPCVHHGQSPPCTSALIEAGIRRVVYATTDPNPLVAGKGHAVLEDNGIEVHAGCLQKEANLHHEEFFLTLALGRPQVTLKLATTMDGMVATHTGNSQWITSEWSRQRAHLLRAQSDAIMVGRGTVEMDDPTLNQRILPGRKGPVRVILDSGLNTSRNSKIDQTLDSIPTWFCHLEDADKGHQHEWKNKGAKLIACPQDDRGQIDVQYALGQLGKLGITSVLCEGGPTVAATLIKKGLVDRYVSFMAGKIFGSGSISAIAPLGISRVDDAAELTLTKVHKLDDNVMCYWSKK